MDISDEKWRRISVGILKKVAKNTDDPEVKEIADKVLEDVDNEAWKIHGDPEEKICSVHFEGQDRRERGLCPICNKMYAVKWIDNKTKRCWKCKGIFRKEPHAGGGEYYQWWYYRREIEQPNIKKTP